MAKQELTAERLRELLHYDPLTGIFTRKVAAGGQPIGARAGWWHKGYIDINVGGSKHRAHRLAWLYVYGRFPSEDLDHIDTIKHHNWIANLREATDAINLQNQRRAKSGSKSGALGVAWDSARRKWYASIQVNGKTLSLGRHTTVELAYAAYVAAKRNYHEGCTL